MMVRRCQPAEVGSLLVWTGENHYRGCTPPGCVCGLEVMEGSARIGALILGRPAAPAFNRGGYTVDTLLELTRMYMVDETERFAETKALAMMRKHVRTWFPQVGLLIAYSDPSVGHEGTIYEADNWVRFGMTGKVTGAGWNSRPGRKPTQNASKQRWLRTP